MLESALYALKIFLDPDKENEQKSMSVVWLRRNEKDYKKISKKGFGWSDVLKILGKLEVTSTEECNLDIVDQTLSS